MLAQCCGNHSSAAPGLDWMPTAPRKHVLHSYTSVACGIPWGVPAGWQVAPCVTPKCGQLHISPSLDSQFLTYLINVIVLMFHSVWKSGKTSPTEACQDWSLSCSGPIWLQLTALDRAKKNSSTSVCLLQLLSYPGNPAVQHKVSVKMDRWCWHFSFRFCSDHSIISSNVHTKLD